MNDECLVFSLSLSLPLPYFLSCFVFVIEPTSDLATILISASFEPEVEEKQGMVWCGSCCCYV